MGAEPDIPTGSTGSTDATARPRDLRTTIYQAKLRPAVNPGHLVPRPRLVELLDRLATAPLTLVSAPAGSGKTSLLREWVEATDLPHAWLSIDETDRDPAQLWLGVLAALEGIAPGCAEPATDELRLQRSVLGAVSALLDDLETRSYSPRVLVIDDLQLVDGDEAVSASLSVFVQHLPAWLHVVVASRRTPRLPVDRLRARGLIGELHFPELRFSVDEAAEMFRRLAPSLPDDRVKEVAVRAGGWAASIQLAAIAARSVDAQATLGVPPEDEGVRFLEDYIWHEVLAGEPAEVVDALLSTAVVERVEPALAEILTGRPDAAALLEEAEVRGLFVTRFEPSGAYEMHGLVREALLSVQRRRAPERLVELHRLAAGWFEADGAPVPALDHLLRAGEPREAVRLLARTVTTLYETGREATIRHTLAALEGRLAPEDLAANVELAWCQLYVDREAFRHTVEHLAGWSRPEGAEGDDVLAARTVMVQAQAASLRGDWAQGARLTRSALGMFGDQWFLDPAGKVSWSLIAREIALAERWEDSAPEVRHVTAAVSIVPERRLSLEGTRALGHALAGRPVDALRVISGARRASDLANTAMLRAELSIAEAVAQRELGDLVGRTSVLLELAETECDPLPYCRLLACLELTRAWLDEGNLDSARRSFGQAVEIVDTEVTAAGARTWLARVGVLVALATGQLEEARTWAAQVEDPFWACVKRARVLIAEGDRGVAFDALKEAEPRCERHRVVLALLLSRTTADRTEAETQLLEAARLAAEHGLVQTVVSEGPEVVDSIERLAWQLPAPWLARLRSLPASGAAAPVATVPLDLIEELTERQLEILRMLPSRLTLREIADQLYISVNTLKFHLKEIYRKLGCGSRAEAAEMVRALVSLRRQGQPSRTTRR
ncbi:LuxR C-terminal-related transcriptional regulator [Nocardioides insulae]|uniref:LuxR C-terminal-related transcriptional regulator n=1 Tax=Nocardioides insulae TaxID=394734 RepID=UPI000425FC89|nr:LuxR C-terminal-related transcriptional regulator [Nocardioides insulae]